MGPWTTIIGVIALALWVAMHVVERRRGEEVKQFTWAFVALAAFVVLSAHGLSIPRTLTGERVHTWNQFHYYVGSKYFGELGYFDLYAATMSADDDWLAGGGDPDAGFAHVRRTRDMHTYRLVPRDQAAASFDRGAITPERLAELGADTRFIGELAGHEKSRRMLSDLGYNPAPPWTLLGTPLANVVDLGGPLYPLITASDVFALAVVFAALWWGFGLRTAAVATVWLHAMPFNHGRMTGAFFTYDWLAAAAVAWACWERERPTLAGVALSWAAMTRVFPGLIAIPIVARVAWSLARRRPLDPRRKAFAVAFCASCAVLLVASHGTGRGLQTWPEWVEKIRMHSDHHPRTGAERGGEVLAHQPQGEGVCARAPADGEARGDAARRGALPPRRGPRRGRGRDAADALRGLAADHVVALLRVDLGARVRAAPGGTPVRRGGHAVGHAGEPLRAALRRRPVPPVELLGGGHLRGAVRDAAAHASDSVAGHLIASLR